MKRSQAGNPAAFEALYREHVGQVYAICLRLSGDDQVAGELTQDVFVRAWHGLATFRSDSSFATWLHRIAYNAAKDHHRTGSRRRARSASVEELDELPARAPEVEKEDHIDLERAIAMLPERARDALILHDIHGYRCREVAEMTGTAVGTIQVHLHRARKLLKELLQR